MLPGVDRDTELPAVRHAPPKKYQVFELEAPVKSSLNVICCAPLTLAASAPSKRTIATEKCLAFIRESYCSSSCIPRRCFRPPLRCWTIHHRRPHRPGRFRLECSGRPTDPSRRCKNSGWHSTWGWRG